MATIDLNSDLGEGFGMWSMGDDARLIPLVSSICTAVDPASRVIVIDPPDGLIDLNAPSGRPRQA